MQCPEERLEDKAALKNDLLFRLMSLEYRFKSLLSPPEKVLNEAGIRKGSVVVDYGCGPGRYTIPVARMVGKEGRVYAIDIHPLAPRP